MCLDGQVIEEKKWREVMARFRFPATTTSASYVLRRYYLSLLHHYEQVYYFRAQGPLVPPAASALTKTPLRRMHRGSDRPATAHGAEPPETGKRPFPERQGGGNYQLNRPLFLAYFCPVATTCCPPYLAVSVRTNE